MKGWLLIAALVGAAILAAAPTFYVTRAVYQRQALQAQKEKSDLIAALATARADLLSKTNALNTLLLEDRNAKQAQMDGVAADLDKLTHSVSSCARKSDVRVTLTPTGTIEAVPGNEQRDLAAAIQEFAAACAVGRDRDAIDHNKLVEWFQRLPKLIEAK
jgi:uncharacterized protein YoxC